MPGFQCDGAFGGFSCRYPLPGCFHAVVDCIPDQVRQGRLQFFQDVPVDGGCASRNLKADLLARFPGHVSDHS